MSDEKPILHAKNCGECLYATWTDRLICEVARKPEVNAWRLSSKFDEEGFPTKTPGGCPGFKEIA